ncbi:MAG: hypothetical protein KIT14_09805 [bacterium]|nr:hypothetical protein [bacterium]
MSRRCPRGPHPTLRGPGARIRPGRVALLLHVLVLVLPAAHAQARDAGDPIRLAWGEGEVSGYSAIYASGGKAHVGTVVFHQTRTGDVITAKRVAYFADGSSDEDVAVARVGTTLETLHGRTTIRDTRGKPTVDLRIDVAGDRVRGFYTDDGERVEIDEAMALPPGTYFGPLVFVVVKSFAKNAEDGRLVFRTVAPTPKPRALDMELVADGGDSVRRPGVRLTTRGYALRPTVFWLIDPLIRKLAPDTHFYVDDGEPPAMVRYVGPRNYAGQRIVVE